MDKKYYITAAIPYVNGLPHGGHALEFVQCDAIARYQKLLGYEALLLSGSDENGLKIVQAAEEKGFSPKQLADKNTKAFRDLVKLLNVRIDVWRRGSDRKLHWPGTWKLWKICEKRGDIYKKNYGGFYCVGCEDFYTKKDLVDGKCPEHLIEPEWVEEENYFFRLSRYQNQIERLVASEKLSIIPTTRKREALAFMKDGLQDFSISRSRERAKQWGIPVPGDPNQVVYTWFDALNIYQTAVGWGFDERLWKKWWPADLHVIGKGILRFHAVYWIGMLLSAELPLPRSILVHGYLTSGGHKMSKSLGNVVDPFKVVEEYGADATRYYLLREIPTHGDGDFTFRRFKQLYAADLANGLGNIISRIAKLCENSGFTFAPDLPPGFRSEVVKHMESYRLDLALAEIWKKISDVDTLIEQQRPWELSGKTLKSVLTELVAHIRQIGFELQPFLPDTASAVLKLFSGPKISAAKPLFPRL